MKEKYRKQVNGNQVSMRIIFIHNRWEKKKSNSYKSRKGYTEAGLVHGLPVRVQFPPRTMGKNSALPCDICILLQLGYLAPNTFTPGRVSSMCSPTPETGTRRSRPAQSILQIKYISKWNWKQTKF